MAEAKGLIGIIIVYIFSRELASSPGSSHFSNVAHLKMGNATLKKWEEPEDEARSSSQHDIPVIHVENTPYQILSTSISGTLLNSIQITLCTCSHTYFKDLYRPFMEKAVYNKTTFLKSCPNSFCQYYLSEWWI